MHYGNEKRSNKMHCGYIWPSFLIPLYLKSVVFCYLQINLMDHCERTNKAIIHSYFTWYTLIGILMLSRFSLFRYDIMNKNISGERFWYKRKVISPFSCVFISVICTKQIMTMEIL